MEKLLQGFLAAALVVSMAPAPAYADNLSDENSGAVPAAALSSSLFSAEEGQASCGHESREEWIPWTGSSFPASTGKYYLTGESTGTFDGPVLIPEGAHVELCLSGKYCQVSSDGAEGHAGPSIVLSEGASLTLCGCQDGSGLAASVGVKQGASASLAIEGAVAGLGVDLEEGASLSVEGSDVENTRLNTVRNGGLLEVNDVTVGRLENSESGNATLVGCSADNIENHGTLSFDVAAENGRGVLSNVNNYGNATIEAKALRSCANMGSGVLTLGNVDNAESAIRNAEDGQLTIAGRVVSSSPNVIENRALGTVMLKSSGAIVGTTCLASVDYRRAILNEGDGSVIIEGGLVDMTLDSSKEDVQGWSSNPVAIEMCGGTLKVEGGFIKGSESGIRLRNNASAIEIDGGVVSGDAGVEVLSKNASLKMTGGEIAGEAFGIKMLYSSAFQVSMLGGKVSGDEGIAFDSWSAVARDGAVVELAGGEVCARNPQNAAIVADIVKLGGNPVIESGEASDIWIPYLYEERGDFNGEQYGIWCQAENAKGDTVSYRGRPLRIAEPKNTSLTIGDALVNCVDDENKDSLQMREEANCRLVYHAEDRTLRLAEIDVEGIEASLSATTIKVDELIEYQVKVLPENATNQQVWVSVSNDVIEQNGEGFLIGKKPGTATLTFYSSDNPLVSKSFVVTVLPKDGDEGQGGSGEEGGDEGSGGETGGDTGGNTGGGGSTGGGETGGGSTGGGNAGGGSAGGGGGTLPPEGSAGEVVTNPDGSETTIVTNDDGSKVETTVSEDGNVTTVVEKNASGETSSIAATVSQEAVAAAGGQAVSLPMEPVKASASSEGAVEIKIDAPKGAKVSVPVAQEGASDAVSSSAVLVLVREDKSEIVLPKTANVGNALVAEVPGECVLKVVDSAVSFPDVNYGQGGDWFADAADFVASRGILYGSVAADGSVVFDGASPTTRGMFVTMLNRLELCPKATSTGGFGDVPEGVYYANPAAWGAENGIVYGVSDGRFDGDAGITREQMALFMMRYADWLGVDTSARTNADTGASSWAADAMSWAVAEGLLVGDGQSFNPQAGATRAEVSTIIARFVNALA